MTTRVTIKRIPGYPGVQLIKRLARLTSTWEEFLRENDVPIRADKFVVFNKGKELSAYSTDKIGNMMQKFIRRAKIHVILVRIKASTGSQQPPQVVAKDKTNTTGSRQGKMPAMVGPHAAIAHSQPGTSRSAVAQRITTTKGFGSSNTLKKYEANPGVLNRAGPSGRPPLPPPPRILQNPGRSTDTNLRMPAFQPQNLSSRGRAIDDDGGSVSSELSQDGDSRTADEGRRLKQEMIDCIISVPGSHFVGMKEELKSLRRGENRRDYRWAHYAPRTAAWVFSAFGV